MCEEGESASLQFSPVEDDGFVPCDPLLFSPARSAGAGSSSGSKEVKRPELSQPMGGRASEYTENAPIQLQQFLFNMQLMSSRKRTYAESMKQPWEKGYMGSVFGGKVGVDSMHSDWLHRPIVLPAVLPDVKDPIENSIGKVFASWKRPVISSAVLKIRRLDTPDIQSDPLRHRAINRWRALIALDLNSSIVGRQLVDFYLDGKSESVIWQILEDTLAKKSTNTLSKRAASLFRYVLYLRKCHRAESLLYREQLVYNYVCSLRDEKSSASTAKSFIEAMSLATFLIGIDVEDKSWKSARVIGATSAMFTQKAPIRQADPLTVDEVRLLHHVVLRSDTTFDIVLAGYFLFCIYACCRWSDPQKLARFVYDIKFGQGYLELGTKEHKTASNDQRKTLILPLVATSPGLGTSDPCWVDSWITARNKMKLKFCEGPTMPCLSNNGSWSIDPMSASEGSASLKGLLEAYGPSLNKSRKVTSHALKSTGLSWCAKRPIKKDFRKALGHHIDSKDTSVSIYSRDYMFAPLLAFDAMLEEIKTGQFFPDDSRAMRSKQIEAKSALQRVHDRVPAEIPKPTIITASVTPTELEQTTVSSSSSSDSSDTSSEGSIPEPREEEAMVQSLGLEAPSVSRSFFTNAEGVPYVVYQHNVSGILHAKLSDFKLVCGRTVSRSFNRLDAPSTLRMKWPKCMDCDSKCENPKFIAPKPKASPATQG